jgi:uncharacterized protein (TIGR02145 family)
MARIKFNTSADEFNGSIFGNTFYSGSKVSTIRNIATGKRAMSPAQALMSGYLIGADRHWRMLTDIERAQWNLFAVTYPQRSNRSPLVFLSGYELFVKRNQHYQIFSNHVPRFMASPVFVEYAIDTPTVAIYSGDDKLEIELTFTRSASDLDCFFTLSAPIHPARYYRPNGPRLIMVCKNVTQTIDITNIYLSIFGRLPDPFQVLNFNMFQAGDDNGQYFFPDQENIIIQDGTDPIVTPVKYGIIYNGYCISDARGVLPLNCHYPTNAEWDALIAFVGGNSIGGGALKETGFIYFASPNTGATNLFNFNGRGSGYRSNGGLFQSINSTCYIWSGTPRSTTGFYVVSLLSNIASISAAGYLLFKYGGSVRPVKDSTTLINGQSGTCMGNDGKLYRTICINGKEWFADNLAETKFRDGSLIPIVTDNASWGALTTSGICAYLNDWSNVLL